MSELDLQPAKPLWHEDRPGPGRPHNFGPDQHLHGHRPHALADSSHRMLQHSVRAMGLHGPNHAAAGRGIGPPPGLNAHAHAQTTAFPHAHLQHRPGQVSMIRCHMAAVTHMWQASNEMASVQCTLVLSAALCRQRKRLLLLGNAYRGNAPEPALRGRVSVQHPSHYWS